MARTINGKLTGRAAAEDLRDMRIYLSDQEELLADQKRECFVKVRDELKALDPTGWEQWYDQFVPDWRGWLNVQPAIDCIAKRVEELRALAPVVAAPETFNNSQTLQWRVASASTLRNYATAIKDFESVTGTKAEQASFITLRQKNAGEREALMKSLSSFDAISKHTAVTDFEAHFLGILKTTPTNTQALTRLLKRCAKKAGIEQTVSLRIWVQTGVYLLKVLSPTEFSFLMPRVENIIKNVKPLHGINRRPRVKVG